MLSKSILKVKPMVHMNTISCCCEKNSGETTIDQYLKFFIPCPVSTPMFSSNSIPFFFLKFLWIEH